MATSTMYKISDREDNHKTKLSARAARCLGTENRSLSFNLEVADICASIFIIHIRSQTAVSLVLRPSSQPLIDLLATVE